MTDYSAISGHIINGDNQIEAMTMAEYLTEFWSDQTTSPRGVQPRLHVVEASKWDEEMEGDVPVYEVWTWGLVGNNPAYTGRSCDSMDEAEDYIMACWAIDYAAESSDCPEFIQDDAELISTRHRARVA